MRPLLLGTLLLALALAPAAEAGIFPYAYRQEKLPNGLTVILIPMDSPGLVTYWSIVRTGSRDEVEPGKSGFAHFFEHMMFRGTKRYPQEAYNRIITSTGAQANAFTTDDFTAYHLTFAKEDLPQVIEMEADRFQNLSYGQRAFQTEAGAVYGEYRKSVTNPMFLLDEKLRDTAYDVHTYKHTTMGFEADVRAMPDAYEYSLSFFHRYYRPENTVLLIVGDVDPPAVLALIRQHYGTWQKGYQAPKIPVEPPQQAPREAEVSYRGKTLPMIEMAYKADAFDPGNRDYVAAILLGELAFGQTSQLYQKLVIQQQKVQFVGADIPSNRDPPLFEILAVVKKAEDIEYVRGQIEQGLKEFQTRPADEKRLGALQRRNKYVFLMELDTPERVARALARPIAVSGGIEVVEQLYAQFDRVTPDDITRAAQKYFIPPRRTVVLLKGAL